MAVENTENLPKRMKAIFQKYWAICLMGTLWIFASCASQGEQSKSKAFGPVNKIVVIADEDLWEGNVGDTARYYLAAPYPVLPQPEKTFDLSHFTAKEMKQDPLRRDFRTMLFIADLTDQSSPVTAMVKEIFGENALPSLEQSEDNQIKFSRDLWAREQNVMFLLADGSDALAEGIRTRFPSIANLVHESDRDIIKAQTYGMGKNGALIRQVKEATGVEVPFPDGFVMADYKQDEKFMWLRKMGREYNGNILLHKLPYTGQEQLTPQGVKAIRDSIGLWISSDEPDTYMIVNDVDLALYHEAKTIDGKFSLMLKGIWEMENDMMGGPFVSLVVHDAEKNELVFLDAFIFAPGEDKRNEMQKLEVVLTGVKI